LPLRFPSQGGVSLFLSLFASAMCEIPMDCRGNY
jgi:hypothetical protein